MESKLSKKNAMKVGSKVGFAEKTRRIMEMLQEMGQWHA